MTLMVRANGDPNALAAALRKAVFEADPEQPVFDVKPLEQIVSNTIAARPAECLAASDLRVQRVAGSGGNLRRRFVFG